MNCLTTKTVHILEKSSIFRKQCSKCLRLTTISFDGAGSFSSTPSLQWLNPAVSFILMHLLLSIVVIWTEGLTYANNSLCFSFAGLRFDLHQYPIPDHWMTKQPGLPTKLKGQNQVGCKS